MQWVGYGIGVPLFIVSVPFGMVGAGGIGATLNTAISRYEYDTAAAILLIIIAIVLLCE